ncbi:hypothetical protein D3C81_1826080 [compost metagenome]
MEYFLCEIFIHGLCIGRFVNQQIEVVEIVAEYLRFLVVSGDDDTPSGDRRKHIRLGYDPSAEMDDASPSFELSVKG